MTTDGLPPRQRLRRGYRGPAPVTPSNKTQSSGTPTSLGKFVVGLAGIIAAIFAGFQYFKPPPTPPTPPPPMPAGRAVYISKADALCRDARIRFQRIGKLPRGEIGPIVEYAADTNSVFDNLYDKWIALRYPIEDDAKVRAVLDAFKGVNAHLHSYKKSLDAAQEAFDQNDDKAFSERTALASDEYQRAGEKALEMDNASEAYGFKICSSVMDFN